MKPHVHARISAKKFGGVMEDYMDIHSFFDTSKQAIADIRHRAILHNSFGIFLCERVYGYTITNSDGSTVAVRDVAEQHVQDDLGFIPTVEDWVKHLDMQPWMDGRAKKTKEFPLADLDKPSPMSDDPTKSIVLD